MSRFISRFPFMRFRWLVVVTALASTLAVVSSSTVLGALVGGALPAAGYTYVSVTDNEVNMTGGGLHLKTKGSTNIKTTYSRVAPNPAFTAGWHFHNGPVIVTVTVGTLTFYDSACATWDVSAGHTYIESTGEILNAKVLPEKNAGITTVEWFTTRLYPEGTTDPVEAEAPCAL
jgi:hypothetical protein